MRFEPIEPGVRGRQQRIVTFELGVIVVEHGAVIDDHHVAQTGQSLDQRQDSVDVFLVLGNEQHGATVAHLIFHFGRRGGRINAVDDGAKGLRGEIADRPFLICLAHDGDAFAAAQAKRGKCLAPCVRPVRRSRAMSVPDRHRDVWNGKQCGRVFSALIRIAGTAQSSCARRLARPS